MRKVIIVLLILGGCSTGEEQTSAPVESETSVASVPERQALFGDLHVHTAFSYDAFVFGTRTDPNDAYEFAKGNPIRHPGGWDLQLDRPLDFQGVSDHANYLGMLPAMMDETSPAYEHPAAETVRNAESVTERRGIFQALQPYVRFVEGSDPSIRDHLNMNVVRSAWREVIDAANRHYEPGKFTTFIAYEYTSAGRGGIYNNLHRNVVFAGADAPPAPFSRLDSFNPEDLWDAMDGWRNDGFEMMSIPHNMNGSGGRMFEFEYFDGGAIDEAYVAQRTRNEPLVEMTQTKGTSETHPSLSPNDEWAAFEIMPYRVSTTILSEPPGSYVRDALRRGLTIASGGVSNPYKFGFIGSSDTHVSAGSFREEDYWGASGLMQGTAEQRSSVPTSNADVATEDDGSGRAYVAGATITNGASGLAAVWAEENTRESIYAAMERKETFATSGPRLRIRLFAGSGLDGIDLDAANLAAQAYARGVPMGADISGDEPVFLAWAMQDRQPLQRLQIVKGWLTDGETHEQVFDVACAGGAAPDPATHRCPDNGASVDLDTCEPVGDGAVELKTVWRDPDFDPGEQAFYYARVLENPTCRWSTWDAMRAGVAPRQDYDSTVQERAWSSPIWYR